MKYIIDRFEGEYAICESRKTGEMINITVKEIPKEAKEGDTIVFANGIYSIDANETKVSREEIQDLMEKLRKK